jgi:pimeloyl-ACP methyl ester carboxylesterase
VPLFAADEGRGPAVLLIHGQPGTGADWAGVARALRDRFRVIVPDRPGYGATGGRAVGIAENADAMAALLADRGVDGAVVAGHSWGAAVALAMAERHADRVRRLVLVNPVAPGDRLGHVDRILAHDRLGAPIARGAFWVAGSALATPPVMRYLGRALPGYGIDRVREVARDWRNGRAWRSFHVEQRALFRELPALRDGLEEVSAPATVVVASADRVTSPDEGRRLAQRIGARLVEVPHAGHLLPMQLPGTVAEAIAPADRRPPIAD